MPLTTLAGILRLPITAVLCAMVIDAGDQLSSVAAQADFDVLDRALEEAHGGFDRFATRAELDRRMALHRARLNRPMSKVVFAGIIAEAIAEIRDGHARLELDSATSASLAGARVFPLRVQLDSDRLMVQLNDSPADSTIRPGMEILRINGRPVADIVGALLPKVSGDGFIETGRRVRLARDFASLFWLYVDQAKSYTVTARDTSGRTITSTLDGVIERDRRTSVNPVNAVMVQNMERLEGPGGNIALQFFDDTDVARLRIRAFNGQGFPATLDSAFSAMREKGTKALILDLRGNGGGVDEYGALLVSYFVNQPFRYFDRIHLTTIAPSFATWLPRTFENLRAGTVPDPSGGFRVTPVLHSGVSEQLPSSHPFPGKLIVLIDGGSFSTTADVAAQLRSRDRATFVGEETAGTYEGNTSGLNALIVLPNSRLRLKIMMYGYWNAVKAPAMPGRGILPDHVVTRRVSDILRGIDPVLERAISLVKPAKAARLHPLKGRIWGVSEKFTLTGDAETEIEGDSAGHSPALSRSEDATHEENRLEIRAHLRRPGVGHDGRDDSVPG